MDNKLANHTAVVTGASSGIGRAIALALASHDANLCLTGRRLELLEDVAAQIRTGGRRCHVYCADLSREEDLQQLAENVAREFGKIDLLVLCGGRICHGGIETTPIAELDNQYQCNLRANYILVQVFLTSLLERQGQIVFINSSAGLAAKAGATHYAATKHGLRALADGLRSEVNRAGIRVLSVYPGRTATPGMEAQYKMRGEKYDPAVLMQPEDVATMVVAAIMLPRTAEVTDISMRPMLKSY